jgi:TonB family protein
MFARLIASGPRPDVRASAASAVALCLHAAVIAGAVYATVRAEEPPVIGRTDDFVIFPPPPRSGPPAAPVTVADPGQGWTVVDPPPIMPLGLPPIDLGVSFDPSAHGGRPVAWRGDPGAPRVTDALLFAAVVDEPPVLLAGPPLAYPELLRMAGIEGRVEVEVVVDTSGRAEAATIMVVRSPHPAFDEPARRYVREALFRPGRMHGRAVRVLVRVPIVFALR